MSYLNLRSYATEIILLVASVLLFACVGYQSYSQLSTLSLDDPQASIQPTLSNDDLPSQLQSITSAGLFGSPVNNSIAATPLDANLIGLFMSPTPQLRKAVLINSAGKQRIVGIDDMVDSQWKVFDIQQNLVILQNAGVKRELHFRKPVESTKSIDQNAPDED